MGAEYFLPTEDFGYLVDVAAEWLAYGIGFGAIFWVVGSVVSLVWSFIRY